MALGSLWSCNDSTLIGQNIILDSTVAVNYNDKAIILAKPISTDPAQMAYPRDECNLPNTVFVTNHDDPVFGSVHSQIYGQFAIAIGATIDSLINMATVDSVKLRLAYEGIFRGDTLAPIELEVYKISEQVEYRDEYALNQSLMTEPSPVGNLTFSPRPRTMRELITRNSDWSLDTSTVSGYETIYLDRQVGQDLLSIDTMILRVDTLLSNELTSFNIRPKGEINSLISFNLFSAQTQMDVYYNIGDTTFGVVPFRYFSNRVNYSQVIHDYDAGSIGSNIGSYAFGDTLLTIDALGGVETEISISDIQIDTNNIINSAYLEITALEYTEETLDFPSRQLALYVMDSDGERALITSALDTPCNINSNFDGQRSFDIEGGENRFLYKLNITEEIQSLVLDKSVESLTFILSTPQNISSPARLKAYGPQSDKFPMTLKISFTEF